ncbi:MAG: hypothetical protein WBD40_07205 [Tepidisphaeraceae bacterium]
MTELLLLDSGPLGQIAHLRPKPEVAARLAKLVAGGSVLVVPEVADYEVRRSLLLHELESSVAELDRLKATLTYLPITTSVMLTAAEL